MHRRLHTAAHLGRKSSRLPLLVPDLPTIARGGTVRIDGAITQVNGAFAQIHRQPAARFEFGINGWVSLSGPKLYASSATINSFLGLASQARTCHRMGRAIYYLRSRSRQTSECP